MSSKQVRVISTKPHFEIRVLIDKADTRDKLDVFRVQVFKKIGKTKTMMFCCSYHLKDDVPIAIPSRLGQCHVATDMWDKGNYVSVGKVVLSWFNVQAFKYNAVDTANNTDLWHVKVVKNASIRYTLYDCSETYVRRNLEIYKKEIAHAEYIKDVRQRFQTFLQERSKQPQSLVV